MERDTSVIKIHLRVASENLNSKNPTIINPTPRQKLNIKQPVFYFFHNPMTK